MKILITGAAGNLGSLLTSHLLPGNHDLHLLTHRTELPFEPGDYPNVSVFKADLGDPGSLFPACRDVDCIVHFAGILFAPRPERFYTVLFILVSFALIIMFISPVLIFFTAQSHKSNINNIHLIEVN